MDHLQDIHSYGLNVKNREIFLHNFLGSNDEANPGVEFRMASAFLKNIPSCSESKFNSPREE